MTEIKFTNFFGGVYIDECYIDESYIEELLILMRAVLISDTDAGCM